MPKKNNKQATKKEEPAEPVSQEEPVVNDNSADQSKAEEQQPAEQKQWVSKNESKSEFRTWTTPQNGTSASSSSPLAGVSATSKDSDKTSAGSTTSLLLLLSTDLTAKVLVLWEPRKFVTS